eukprot:SAG11_NODE_2153_length_3740_cov_13.654765_4_plen_185_part_00
MALETTELEAKLVLATVVGDASRLECGALTARHEAAEQVAEQVTAQALRRERQRREEAEQREKVAQGLLRQQQRHEEAARAAAALALANEVGLREEAEARATAAEAELCEMRRRQVESEQRLAAAVAASTCASLVAASVSELEQLASERADHFRQRLQPHVDRHHVRPECFQSCGSTDLPLMNP